MRLVHVFACLFVLPVAACVQSSAPPATSRAGSTEMSPVIAPRIDETPRGDFAVAPEGAQKEEASASTPASNLGQSARAGQPLPAAAPRSAEAGADSADAFRGRKKLPLERPGLGTQWGETRTSHVTSQAFERADFSRPFAQLSLNYNDYSGIRATAARVGNDDVSLEPNGVQVGQGSLKFRLLDENGAPIPGAHFGGRDYVSGVDGQRYVIEISNDTPVRLEAVASVDGLDVIDGRPGSYDKRGYLIDPGSTLQIDGFRRSRAQVAAFRFGAVKDSYAAGKGNDGNVGVIGVAFFQEQGSSWPWTERELERRDSARPFPGSFAAPPVGQVAH